MANPLYPGYYPGTPQDKRPGSGGGSQINPTEFNFDEIAKYIDNISPDFDKMGPGFSQWVYERVMDDWKQSMKASILPKYVAQEDIDDYDPASLPGAFGVSVDMNPVEWAKDPAGMAKKTVQGWVKSGLNWQDMETRYRQRAWKDVFSQNPAANDVFAFENIGTATLGANIAAQSGVKGTRYSETDNPLQLNDRNIRRYVGTDRGTREMNVEVTPNIDSATGKITGAFVKTTDEALRSVGTIDVMKEFANSVASYETQTAFGPKRDTARDNVAYNGYRAIVTELEQHEKLDKILQTNPAMAEALKGAQAHLDVYESMQTIGKQLGDYGDDLKKKVMSKKPLFANDAQKVAKSVNEHLEAIDARIAKLAADGLTKEATYLRKYTEPYKKQIKGILSMGALDPTRVESMSAVSALNSILSTMEGGARGTPVKDGRIFNPSIPRTLLHNMENDITRPGIRGNTLGTLVHEVAKEDSNLASRAVLGGMVYVRNTGEINGAMDVLTALEKGNLMERYLWPRVKTYWQASTPGAYTSRFMERHNYFGLVVKNEDAFENSVIFQMSNLFHDKKAPEPNKAFGHWFDVKENFKEDVQQLPSLQNVRLSGAFYGGRHFSAVGSMSGIIEANKWGKNPAALAHFMKVIDLNNDLGIEQNIVNALGKINPNSDFMKELIRLNGGKMPKFMGSLQDDKMYEFMKDLASFKQWVEKNKNRFNININENNDSYYLALFTALSKIDKNPDFLKITQKYAGGLEKIFTRLNRTQSALYKSAVGKVIAPAVYAKKAISDAISTVITKLISVIGGSGSGGVLAPVMAIIEPIVRFIVRVIVDKTSEIVGVFYKALVKADIDSALNYMDKQAERYFKVALIIVGSFTMLIIIPADNFMGAIATTFPPTDNTLVGGIGDSYGGIRLGSGVKIEPQASKPSSVGCFEFADYDLSITILGQTLQLAPWPGQWQSVFDKKAIPALQEVSGGYLERLCEKGPVKLVWALDDKDSGYCGIALSAGSFAGSEAIIFGNNRYCYSSSGYPEWWHNYLFAHETGHIYSYRIGMETINGISFSGVTGGGEGTFTTYPGHCNDSNLDQDEDFAETIGHWVQINTADCRVPGTFEAFWGQWPKHYEYADKVLTRP